MTSKYGSVRDQTAPMPEIQAMLASVAEHYALFRPGDGPYIYTEGGILVWKRIRPYPGGGWIPAIVGMSRLAREDFTKNFLSSHPEIVGYTNGGSIQERAILGHIVRLSERHEIAEIGTEYTAYFRLGPTDPGWGGSANYQDAELRPDPNHEYPVRFVTLARSQAAQGREHAWEVLSLNDGETIALVSTDVRDFPYIGSEPDEQYWYLYQYNHVNAPVAPGGFQGAADTLQRGGKNEGLYWEYGWSEYLGQAGVGGPDTFSDLPMAGEIVGPPHRASPATDRFAGLGIIDAVEFELSYQSNPKDLLIWGYVPFESIQGMILGNVGRGAYTVNTHLLARRARIVNGLVAVPEYEAPKTGVAQATVAFPLPGPVVPSDTTRGRYIPLVEFARNNGWIS